MRHISGFLLLLTLTAPGQVRAASPAARPVGMDAEQWAVVQRGMGELDDAALRSLVWLDANAVIELRPSRLREMGLWRPTLEALPRALKVPYEQVTAMMGADPFSRLDSIIIAARGLRGWGGDEEVAFDGLQILARGHDGLLTDFVRALAGRTAGDDDNGGGATPIFEFVFAETLNAEAIAVLTQPPVASKGDRVLAATPGAVVSFEPGIRGEAGVSITGPHGVAGTSTTVQTDGEALQAAFKLLRRLQSARTGAAKAPRVAQNLLGTARIEQWPTARGPVDLRLELRLDQNLELDLRFAVPFAPGSEAQIKQRLSDGEVAAGAAAKWGVVAWLPMVAGLAKSSRVSVRGNTVHVAGQVPAGLVAEALGGAAFAPIEGAAEIGRGVDTAALLASAVQRPKEVQPFQSQAQVGDRTGGVYFGDSTNPRSRAFAHMLRTEGSIQRLAAALHENIRWPSPVPLEFADCGTVNAFYSSKAGSVVLCYELMDDLLTKLAGRFDNENLAAAVIGAALFIAMHEFGHAMVDKLDLPVTGKQEDAVDQLATLVLLNAGDEGVGYAMAAMLWFDASASLAGPPAFWDEHSTDAQRAFSTTCLIYGSNPTKYARIAGSRALPKSRAVRCPGEFAQVSRAWSKLIAPHER